MTVAIKVIVADHHELVREGICSLISRHSEFEVVGQAANGRHAVRMARELTPTVAVLAIDMPELNGIDATRQIRAAKLDTRVVILSVHGDGAFVEAAIEAGVKGYLLKNSAASELPLAIMAAAKGEIYLTPKVSGTIVHGFVGRHRTGVQVRDDKLSPREREVLQLLAEGKTSKEIGGILHISSRTVETHKTNIMDTLELRTVAELTKWAIRNGLTSLED